MAEQGFGQLQGEILEPLNGRKRTQSPQGETDFLRALRP